MLSALLSYALDFVRAYAWWLAAPALALALLYVLAALLGGGEVPFQYAIF